MLMALLHLLVRLTLNWRVGSAVQNVFTDEMMNQSIEKFVSKWRPCISVQVHQFIKSLNIVEL